MDKILKEKIDYLSVEDKLKWYREKSMDFLTNALLKKKENDIWIKAIER